MATVTLAGVFVHFPRAVQMNMELKTDVGFSMLLHKGKWGTGRGGRLKREGIHITMTDSHC